MDWFDAEEFAFPWSEAGRRRRWKPITQTRAKLDVCDTDQLCWIFVDSGSMTPAASSCQGEDTSVCRTAHPL